jgi:hypothetical protein
MLVLMQTCEKETVLLANSHLRDGFRGLRRKRDELCCVAIVRVAVAKFAIPAWKGRIGEMMMKRTEAEAEAAAAIRTIAQAVDISSFCIRTRPKYDATRKEGPPSASCLTRLLP